METKNKIITGVIVSVVSTLLVGGITTGVAKLSPILAEKNSDVLMESSINSSLDEDLNEACDHVKVVVPGKSATCEEDGLTDGRTCALCGEVIVAQEVIPALGHEWVEESTLVEATCMSAGTLLYSCTGCNTTKTEGVEKLPHNIIEHPELKATCISNGSTSYKSCKDCGVNITFAKKLPPLCHEFEDGYCIRCSIPELNTHLQRFSNPNNYTEIGGIFHTEIKLGSVYRFYFDESSEVRININGIQFFTLNSFNSGFGQHCTRLAGDFAYYRSSVVGSGEKYVDVYFGYSEWKHGSSGATFIMEDGIKISCFGGTKGFSILNPIID